MASKNCLNNTADYFLKLDAVMKVFDINIYRMGLFCFGLVSPYMIQKLIKE